VREISGTVKQLEKEEELYNQDEEVFEERSGDDRIFKLDPFDDIEKLAEQDALEVMTEEERILFKEDRKGLHPKSYPADVLEYRYRILLAVVSGHYVVDYITHLKLSGHSEDKPIEHLSKNDLVFVLEAFSDLFCGEWTERCISKKGVQVEKKTSLLKTLFEYGYLVYTRPGRSPRWFYDPLEEYRVRSHGRDFYQKVYPVTPLSGEDVDKANTFALYTTGEDIASNSPLDQNSWQTDPQLTHRYPADQCTKRCVKAHTEIILRMYLTEDERKLVSKRYKAEKLQDELHRLRAERRHFSDRKWLSHLEKKWLLTINERIEEIRHETYRDEDVAEKLGIAKSTYYSRLDKIESKLVYFIMAEDLALMAQWKPEPLLKVTECLIINRRGENDLF